MNYVYVLSAVTENTPRVLQRMAGIFARNRLNIERLTVFGSDNNETSIFNIVIRSDVKTIQRVIKQLQKIVELMEIKINSQTPLPKVSATHEYACLS